jgi:hypothetical protein
MYEQNVHAGCQPSFIVAVSDDTVVGYIHRMYLPWIIDGRECRVPTIHNFLVKKSFRAGKDLLSVATAAGLLKHSLRGELHAVLPSAFQPLAEVYRRMNCQPIETRWFRKALRPVTGAILLALNRLKELPHKSGRRLPDLSRLRDCQVLESPGFDQLTALSQELLRQTGRDTVIWTPELVKWRFFHRSGPRHVFVQFDNPGEFAVLSLGPRQGILLGRIIVLSDAAAMRGPSVIHRLCDVLRHLGAHAAAVTTGRDDISKLLTQSGFSLYPDQQQTYLFHKEKAFVQHTVVGPEITDLGFEAIMR